MSASEDEDWILPEWPELNLPTIEEVVKGSPEDAEKPEKPEEAEEIKNFFEKNADLIKKKMIAFYWQEKQPKKRKAPEKTNPKEEEAKEETSSKAKEPNEFSEPKKSTEKPTEEVETPETPGEMLANIANGRIPGYQDANAFRLVSEIRDLPLVIATEGRVPVIRDLKEIARCVNPEEIPGSELSLADWIYKLINEIERIDGRMTKTGSVLAKSKTVLHLLHKSAFEGFKENCKSLNTSMGNLSLKNHEEKTTPRFSQKGKGKGKKPERKESSWNSNMTTQHGKSFETRQKHCYICGTHSHWTKHCPYAKHTSPQTPEAN